MGKTEESVEAMVTCDKCEDDINIEEAKSFGKAILCPRCFHIFSAMYDPNAS